MERNAADGLISPEEIAKNYPYGFRFDYRDPLLEASLETRGILTPILVAPYRRMVVLIAGHKRFFHAVRKKLKKMPAIFVKAGFSEKELFLLSVYSNWNQNMPDLDRMKAIGTAEKDFKLTSEEVRDEILPALGLSPRDGILEEYRRVGALSEKIHSLLGEKKLPFRGAASLEKFSLSEQSFLAGSVFKQIHLTTNQIILISGWLSDLKKIRKCVLEELFQEEALKDVLKNSNTDPRTRGEMLFEVLRALRFPRLSEEEKSFRRLKSKIEEEEEIRLERPEGFEAEGVFLHARLRDRKKASRVLDFLESHRSILESYL